MSKKTTRSSTQPAKKQPVKKHSTNRLNLNQKSLNQMLADSEFEGIEIVNGPGRGRKMTVYLNSVPLVEIKTGVVKNIRGLRTIIRKALAANEAGSNKVSGSRSDQDVGNPPAHVFPNQQFPRALLPKREPPVDTDQLSVEQTIVALATTPLFKDAIVKFQGMSENVQLLQRVREELSLIEEIVLDENRRSYQSVLSLLQIDASKGPHPNRNDRSARMTPRDCMNTLINHGAQLSALAAALSATAKEIGFRSGLKMSMEEQAAEAGMRG